MGEAVVALPTLEEHLTMAKSTATKVGASGGSKSSSETPKKSSGSK